MITYIIFHYSFYPLGCSFISGVQGVGFFFFLFCSFQQANNCLLELAAHQRVVWLGKARLLFENGDSEHRQVSVNKCDHHV